MDIATDGNFPRLGIPTQDRMERLVGVAATFGHPIATLLECHNTRGTSKAAISYGSHNAVDISFWQGGAWRNPPPVIGLEVEGVASVTLVHAYTPAAFKKAGFLVELLSKDISRTLSIQPSSRSSNT